MTIALTGNNTISTVGNFRVVSFATSFDGVSVVSYSDDIEGFPTPQSPSVGYEAVREWRWSEDGLRWSLWERFQPADFPFQQLSGKPLFWLEFRISVQTDTLAPTPTPAGTPISPAAVLTSITLDVLRNGAQPETWIEPSSRCSAEKSFDPALVKKASFNPYAVNKAIGMAQQLSSSVSRMFGHDVTYFKVSPQERSKDIVFMEWTIMYAQDPKCFKILIPDNNLPDSKQNYNPFGSAFELPFEVHIDKTEWEETFGRNTMPQEGDFLYLPLNNRMYEVQSSYPYRDFMQVPIYYKVLLVKYENRMSVIKDNVQSMLDAATTSVEEMFGDEIEKQKTDALKPQQNRPSTSTSDPARSYVAKQLSVVNYKIYNNYNVVADTYYSMKGMFSESGAPEPAVLYHAAGSVMPGEERSFMCWVAPSSGADAARRLISCLDGSGRGWAVTLTWSPALGGSTVTLRYNATDYSFPLQGLSMPEDQWHAIVVNFSTAFSQCSVSVYRTQIGKPELERCVYAVLPFTDQPCETSAALGLITGMHIITNIRVFKEMVDQDNEPLVLTQNVVADASKALVIDNARPVLRLVRYGTP